MQKDPHRYDNLIDNPRPLAKAPMDGIKRAAQFAPFAALTGYEEQINETARITDDEMILDENEKDIIDYRLQYLQENIDKQLTVEMTYFVSDKSEHKDSNKSGGKYVKKRGTVKRFDLYEKCVVFTDGERLSIESIVAIDI